MSKCDKCKKTAEELHSKSEYLDLTISKEKRLIQAKLHGKELCTECWDFFCEKYELPKYNLQKC